MIQHTFQGQTSGPHLLITGGVHGDEFEPIAALRQLTQEFRESSTLAVAMSGRVTIVPVVNEAAFLRGQRCATDELDLARTCPGRADGSETEQVAWELSQLIGNADYYIDLHTGGTELTIQPLAGYMLHQDPDVLTAQRRMATAFNLPVVWGTSAEHDGRSLSVARDAGVPAIYCESGGAATCQADGVSDYVAGCRLVMRELGMLTASAPASRVTHIVEDDRPTSGHLQICHPAPHDGYFAPTVHVGQTVQAGDPLGTVFDLTSTDHWEIQAESSGLVLVLRTFPRVLQNESVGVVLDLSAPHPVWSKSL